MNAVCVCTGEGRNYRPCCYHFSFLSQDQKDKILYRLKILNPRPIRRS